MLRQAVIMLDYLQCGRPCLFGLHARRAGAAQALSVANFKALAYSKDHREPCKRESPRRADAPVDAAQSVPECKQ